MSYRDQNGYAGVDPPYGHSNGKMDSMKRGSGYAAYSPTDAAAHRDPDGATGYQSGKRTCCRRFAGHPKGVSMVLIMVGGVAVLAQVITIVLGAHLSYACAGIWTGILVRSE